MGFSLLGDGTHQPTKKHWIGYGMDQVDPNTIEIGLHGIMVRESSAKTFEERSTVSTQLVQVSNSRAVLTPTGLLSSTIDDRYRSLYSHQMDGTGNGFELFDYPTYLNYGNISITTIGYGRKYSQFTFRTKLESNSATSLSIISILSEACENNNYYGNSSVTVNSGDFLAFCDSNNDNVCQTYEVTYDIITYNSSSSNNYNHLNHRSLAEACGTGGSVYVEGKGQAYCSSGGMSWDSPIAKFLFIGYPIVEIGSWLGSLVGATGNATQESAGECYYAQSSYISTNFQLVTLTNVTLPEYLQVIPNFYNSNNDNSNSVVLNHNNKTGNQHSMSLNPDYFHHHKQSASGDSVEEQENNRFLHESPSLLLSVSRNIENDNNNIKNTNGNGNLNQKQNRINSHSHSHSHSYPKQSVKSPMLGQAAAIGTINRKLIFGGAVGSKPSAQHRHHIHKLHDKNERKTTEDYGWDHKYYARKNVALQLNKNHVKDRKYIIHLNYYILKIIHLVN